MGTLAFSNRSTRIAPSVVRGVAHARLSLACVGLLAIGACGLLAAGMGSAFDGLVFGAGGGAYLAALVSLAVAACFVVGINRAVAARVAATD